MVSLGLVLAQGRETGKVGNGDYLCCGDIAHPSSPTLLRLQSLHWSDWWLRHRLEVPRGERGTRKPKHPRSTLLPSWEKVAGAKRRSDEGASDAAPKRQSTSPPYCKDPTACATRSSTA